MTFTAPSFTIRGTVLKARFGAARRIVSAVLETLGDRLRAAQRVFEQAAA